MRFFIFCFSLAVSTLGALGANAILISPPELKEAWETYAEVRKAAGIEIKVMDTAMISKEFSGPDLQEKIRKCVRKSIDDTGVKYVILGGDSSPGGGLIPDRDSVHVNMWGEAKDTPTDIYYISPTDWDMDKDGVYGEWKEDKEAISYPDGTVAIGRISVRTVSDVQAYTKKVEAYLKTVAEKELALTCAVRGAYAKVFRTGQELKEFLPVSLFFNDFTSWDKKTEGDYDLSTSHVLTQMNEGKINKWHLHGHGLEDRWVLENDESFDTNGVKALSNMESLLVMTTVSCFTGQFDSEFDPCIAESMLRHPTGGAIAIVAPAREGKPHFHNPEEDFEFMVNQGKRDGTTQTMAMFWKSALKDKKSIGMAYVASKASLADDAVRSATYHQGICEINLLGDPTLPVK